MILTHFLAFEIFAADGSESNAVTPSGRRLLVLASGAAGRSLTVTGA